VVSNHGGTQVDGVLVTIDALPAFAEAVGGVALYLDRASGTGPTRSRPWCWARAALIGRLITYGLASHREEGVRRILEILAEEIETALIISGCDSAQELLRGLAECCS
jgi:isopentenyl diphosphate isomerase/L-lactate dehydrogenase-like FMN-dependent dehydrogenase